MRKLFRVGLYVVCLSSFFSLSLVAQQAEKQLQPGGQAKADASAPRTVQMDVVVTDHAGKAVSGLKQQDFSVFDNKQPAKVLSFQAEAAGSLTPDSPVEVLLLMDEVNTSFERMAYERDEIKKFLTANNGKLTVPVSLVFFSDAGTQVQQVPSVDGNSLSAAIDQHAVALRSIRRSNGVYGAEDRLQLSLDTLEGIAKAEAKKPGRKLLLWVSPGWPLLSGPRIDLTQKQEQSVFNSAVRITTALRQSRITLYSIDPLGLADAGGVRTIYYREFLKGLSSPKNAQIGNLGLQVFATNSGGQVMYASNSIHDELKRCVDDASAFYVMTIPSAPADRGNDYHEIEVRTGTPGLTVRTIAGYYAQP